MRLFMQFLGRGNGARCVVRQERRDFQRHPAIDAVGTIKDRLEQIGRAVQILQRQVEEQIFAAHAGLDLLGDRRVIGRAVLEGEIEDRRVRGQPGHRKLGDIFLQGAVVQQVAGDVVEPNALAEIMEFLGGVHAAIS